MEETKLYALWIEDEDKKGFVCGGGLTEKPQRLYNFRGLTIVTNRWLRNLSGKKLKRKAKIFEVTTNYTEVEIKHE